jgi:type I restriction enzyme, R subunit
MLTEQLSSHKAKHPFNGNQIRFLRGVQSVFQQKRRLELADLYDPPLDSFGQDAVEQLFSDLEIESILTFTQSLSLINKPMYRIGKIILRN